MARYKAKPRGSAPKRAAGEQANSPQGEGRSRRAHLGGVLSLALGIAASLLLALEHLGGLQVPGCGAGSPCAAAAASVWGRVPYVDWPVSFLGLAYFTGMLSAWLPARRGVPAGLRALVRVGVLISLGFVTVMLVEGYLCAYCLAAHLGNLAFWLALERARGVRTGSVRALATLAGVFVVVTGVLGLFESVERRSARARAERELAGSTDAIIAATSQRARPSETPLATAPVVEPIARTDGASPEVEGRGFTGRYRRGPEAAAIRVVVVTDYQCKECRQLEAEVTTILEQRDDLSVSFKHFPRCSDCNRAAKSRAHPNACWAARAAETAGILRGADGFWRVHAWLFERRGSFTREELRAALREFGYEIPEFERIMQSDETLALVRADVEEALTLGVWFTPTIYVNGVELRGWNAPNAVARAVGRLAATNPPAVTAAQDHPPPALEKLIGDWKASPQRSIPAGAAFRSRGPDDAKVEVTVFGDLQLPGTVEVDAILRRVVADRADTRYSYRHFPFDPGCNPAVKGAAEHPNACRVACAAEAAGVLGGAEAYWSLHAWLLETGERFTDADLRETALGIGLDAEALFAKMEDPAIQAAVTADAVLGQRLQITAVPAVFVNGRRVPRWKLEDENILPRVVADAAAE